MLWYYISLLCRALLVSYKFVDRSLKASHMNTDTPQLRSARGQMNLSLSLSLSASFMATE